MTPRPLTVRQTDEFGIEIDFVPGSDAPGRIFKAMYELVESFQKIDSFLAKSISVDIQPSMLLEDIERASLRAWFKNALESVDDDSLKSGDWKKIVGTYLVSAKRIMIKWTEKKTTVESAGEIEVLRQEIVNLAARTDVLRIPTYVPITSMELVESVEMLTRAIQPLGEGEIVMYLTADEPTVFNRTFDVAPESLRELLVKESIPFEAVMILRVKRPDFLGDSRWEFRHDSHPFEARIEDAQWMLDFRNGTAVLLPGDALRCLVRSEVRYGYDAEVVDSKHEVIKVLEVIPAIRPSQSNLFKPPEVP